MEFVRSSRLSDAGFVHGFTTREGGASGGAFESLNLAFDLGDDPALVSRNMMLMEEAVGSRLPLARVRQVHGLKPVEASEALLPSWTTPPRVEADGIISDGTEAILAVQTADCAAVLIADPSSRIVAAVHAGWRGAAGGLIRNTVRRMGQLGAPASDLIAVIGPCICQRCYEVGEEVARRLPESADPIRRSPGRYLLDLGNAVEVSLIGAGLTSSNIDNLGLCTSCDERFFSHRKSGGACGRNLGFIVAGPH